MKYANTMIAGGTEKVVVVLPLSAVPDWDSSNPQEGTYLVPENVEPGWVKNVQGVFVAPTPTLQELRAQAKKARAAAVAAITVQVGGKVFDGDEVSQGRMARAIVAMQAAQAPTINWTLADNTVVDVTVAELTQALIMAGQRQAELWPISV